MKRLEGYIIKYNSKSRPFNLKNGRVMYEQFAPHAFADSIRNMNTALNASPINADGVIRFNVNHTQLNPMTILGDTTRNVKLEDRSEGVYMTCDIADDSLSEDTWTKVKAEFLRGLSIEFRDIPGYEPAFTMNGDGSLTKTYTRAGLNGFAVVVLGQYADAIVTATEAAGTFHRSLSVEASAELEKEVEAFLLNKNKDDSTTPTKDETSVSCRSIEALENTNKVISKMDIKESEKKIVEIATEVASQNRSITAAEQSEIESLKAEVKAIKEAALNAQTKVQEVKHRSVVAAQEGTASQDMSPNEYFRSLTTGATNLGNKLVYDETVRVYEEQVPIFAAHGNVKKNLTGNTFSFAKFTPGTISAAKTEDSNGTADTTSTMTMKEITFATYSSDIITVTQEALEDAGFDINGEIMSMGMSKSTSAFGTAIYVVLDATTRTQTASTSFALSDVISAYYSLPNRNRSNVKFIGNSTTIGAIANLLTTDALPRTNGIGLNIENLIVDSTASANQLYVGDPTKYIAIGMKVNPRVVVLEVSKGRTYEIQPRLAVGLRDATAIVRLEKKLS